VVKKRSWLKSELARKCLLVREHGYWRIRRSSERRRRISPVLHQHQPWGRWECHISCSGLWKLEP
jgi:hypothetical protein